MKFPWRRYFLSFIGEAIFNPDYQGYHGGRVEVYDERKDSPYAIEEMRYFTRDPAFNKFRNEWDFRNVSRRRLDKIRKTLWEKFYEDVT